MFDFHFYQLIPTLFYIFTSFVYLLAFSFWARCFEPDHIFIHPDVFYLCSVINHHVFLFLCRHPSSQRSSTSQERELTWPYGWDSHSLYAVFMLRNGQTLTSLSVCLCLQDTAGQERFHALGPIYYRDSNGAILVYDITDEDSFQKVQLGLTVDLNV